MDKNKANTHLFALYYQATSTYNAQFVITDDQLVHRISRVLRLAQGDACIFFDRTSWISCTITQITRTTVAGTINAKHTVQSWHPKITFFLPVLKRDALATAVYDLVQAGVQEIQLLRTQKAQHAFGTQELQRLERIIIAAAEQSKNFAFPAIQEPISWSQALLLLQKNRSYVGDPTGMPIFTALGTERHNAYNLLVGPEGDFTLEESAQLQKAGVMPVRLTPTILKAETAAFYLAALWRSYIS